MILRQTWAILIDAYRELNSKKMFWVCLVLSGVFVAVFGCVGIGNGQFTFLGWNTSIPHNFASPAEFYKTLFAVVGIDLWLTWAGLFLALISTASLFPDFLASGAVDLYLARPISRTRLFFTKYLAGLLFAFLQALVFTVACVVVLGIRAGAWLPELLLAVPIVVLLFSYFFCWSVLAGVLTRSTIAAVLLTLALSVAVFMTNAAESTLLGFREGYALMIEKSKKDPTLIPARELMLQMADAKLKADAAKAPDEETRDKLEANRRALAQIKEELRDAEGTKARLDMWHSVAFAAKTILPKTTETRGLLNKALEVSLNRKGDRDEEPLPMVQANQLRAPSMREFRKSMNAELERRTPLWVLSSSMAFQGVVLLAGVWVFVRRDY